MIVPPGGDQSGFGSGDAVAPEELGEDKRPFSTEFYVGPVSKSTLPIFAANFLMKANFIKKSPDPTSRVGESTPTGPA